MATEPFKEDFFERLIDINWETEPEVFWLVGAGNPAFVNGLNYGDLHGYVWRSSDGKHWYGTDLWRPGLRGFGGLFSGVWFRKDLAKGAPPIWVIGGGTNRSQPSSCVGYSLDGETFSVDTRTVFDLVHICENFYPGDGFVFMEQMITFAFYLHFDYFKSSDGIHWAPPNFHGGVTDAPGMVAAAAGARTFASSAESKLVSIIDPALTPENTTMESLMAAAAAPAVNTASMSAVRSAEATPFAGIGAQLKSDEILYIHTQVYATGRVKKGPFRGRRLIIQIYPYHYPYGGGAHGDNTVMVIDAKTGQQLGIFKSGVQRSISIGYGHYVFVVTGSGGAGSAAGQKSTLAWSEDAINWKVINLGNHNQINAIAVGPRPAGAKPTPPKPTETSIDGKLIGTGQLPKPPS